MKAVVLRFSDAINLKAFLLVENPRSSSIDEANLLLHGKLTEGQICKALQVYGAALCGN